MRCLACVLALTVAACTRPPEPTPAVIPAVSPVISPPIVPAPPPAPAARTSLEVHTGHAGATVLVSDGGDEPMATATTDAAGIARFPQLVAGEEGDREIWAIADGAASPVSRIAAIPDRPIELALQPAATIHGHVSGATKARGSVELAPIDLDHEVRHAPIDAEGRFTLDGLPVGRWRLEVSIPGFVSNATEVVARAAPLDVQLAVERAGTLTGNVVDDRGGPIRGATIVARRQDAHGDLGLRIAPRFHGRWVYPLAGQRALPSNPSAQFGATRVGIHIPECGLGHCGIDLVMPRGSVVHAVGDGEVIVARTDSRDNAGRFVAIDHGRGLVTMYMHLDQLREGLEVGQKIRAGSTLGTVGSSGFDPNMAPPHLHFAVTQASGERGARAWYLDPEPMLRHAVVLAAPRSLSRVDDGTAVIEPREDGRATSSVAVTTDDRGRFTIGDLPPGEYVVLAHAVGLAAGASAPVEVRGASASTTIALYPGTLVRGVVTANGRPIAGATVAATAGAGEAARELATAYTDARGGYELRALSGPVTLSAAAPHFGTASHELELSAPSEGSPQRAQDFALALEDASLRGAVTSPDGAVANATVKVARGPSVRAVTVDAHGEFSFGRVARGHYALEISSPGHPRKRVEADSDQFVEVRLEPSGALQLAIDDATSRMPLANVRVEAHGPDGATASARSDARGIATLDGLTVGGWTVTLQGADHAKVSRDVAVRASHLAGELRVELARTSTLAGTVRDRRGARVAGARVVVGDAATTADADGNFRLAGVVGSALVIEATREGAQRGTLAITVVPGDERANLNVELDAWR